MPVTICLIAANLIVFCIYVMKSSWAGLFVYQPTLLFKMGAVDSASILYLHQYWRLVAALFLHANIQHIFFNMVSLFLFGRMLEKPLGSARFLVLYFVSGLFGALLSVALHTYGESVGASGAILGLVGFYIYVQLQSDKKDHPALSYRLRQLLGLGLALYALSLTPGVDNAGHVGGLIAGIICGVAFRHFSNLKVAWTKRDFFITAIMAFLFAGALYGEERTLGHSTSMSSAVILRQTEELLQAHQYKDAISKLDEALTKNDQDDKLLLLRAEVLADQHIYPLALADCDRLLSFKPDDARALLLRGAINYSQGNFDKALDDTTKALAVNKNYALAYNQRGCILLAIGKYEEALADARRANQINDHFAEALDTEAMALAYQGADGKALPLLERAIDADDAEHGIYFYHRSLIYAAMGDKNKAADDMTEAQKRTYTLEKWETERPLPRPVG